MHGRYYSVWPNLEKSVFKINLFISYILECVVYTLYKFNQLRLFGGTLMTKEWYCRLRFYRIWNEVILKNISSFYWISVGRMAHH